jgi:protein-disulfide isomerase-like protein with CxxC motif
VVRINVTHFSDPGCPWAYSAAPALAVLQWRFGEQLAWRHVMIGLAEDPERYVRAGRTPASAARGYRRFRARGMPFATEPRERIPATGPACRAVVATRLRAPQLEWAAFRALQLAWFTTPLVLDEDEALRTALETVPELDVAAIVAAIEAPDVREAYAADREAARSAAGGPTEAMGRAADTDGAVRFTAPSLVFTTPDGGRLEAGGFLPVEAYDLCLANLDPGLERRPPPDDVVVLVAAFPHGLTTREVAACLAERNAAPDDDAAEDRLIDAVAEGHLRRRPVGDGALWLAAGSRAAAARLAA